MSTFESLGQKTSEIQPLTWNFSSKCIYRTKFSPAFDNDIFIKTLGIKEIKWDCNAYNEILHNKYHGRYVSAEQEMFESLSDLGDYY